VTLALEPNRIIAWKGSMGGAIDQRGHVIFCDLSPTETEITASIQYSAPAGYAEDALGNWMDEPEKKLADELENFKRYVERISGRTRHQ
jgi:uncharacterized membrane protein